MRYERYFILSRSKFPCHRERSSPCRRFLLTAHLHSIVVDVLSKRFGSRDINSCRLSEYVVRRYGRCTTSHNRSPLSRFCDPALTPRHRHHRYHRHYDEVVGVLRAPTPSTPPPSRCPESWHGSRDKRDLSHIVIHMCTAPSQFHCPHDHTP